MTNRKIYSVMSVGVQNFTEDQCREMFPVIKAGIVLILEQQLAAKRRLDLENETAAKIHALQGKISGGDMPDED